MSHPTDAYRTHWKVDPEKRRVRLFPRDLRSDLSVYFGIVAIATGALAIADSLDNWPNNQSAREIKHSFF